MSALGATRRDCDRMVQWAIILIIIAVVSTCCILGARNAMAEEAWLRAHNLYRCMHNVPALFWSNHLAALALNTAKMCDCSHCNPQTLGKYSENGTCYLPKSPGEAVDDWYNEIANYDYDKPQYVSQNKKTGHFINVVAKGLTSVGCGCTNQDCYCVYGGFFDWSSPAGLKGNVLKPIRSKQQCQINAIDYCRSCQGGQGQWVAQTHDCWRLDGYGLGTAGNPGTGCQICWQSGNVTGCGTSHPPMAGVWHKKGGETAWAGEGGPDYPKDCWDIIGKTDGGRRCQGAVDIKGIKINGQPACWVRVDSVGKSVGDLIDCEY